MNEVPTTASAAADEQPRRRRRGIVAVLLALTTLSLGAGMFSLAVFTDSADSSGTFATGNVDISSTPTVDIGLPAMIPGDSGIAAVTVSNDGTADLRYAMTAVASGALGAALNVEIRAEGDDCATFNGASVLGETGLDGAAFGDATQGPDTGDRELASGASEVLCFKVSLPIGADSSVQDATSDATFTFEAEQTANNP